MDGNTITASFAQVNEAATIDIGQSDIKIRFNDAEAVEFNQPITSSQWYSSSYITNTALPGDQNEGNLGSAFIGRGAQFDNIYSNDSASKVRIELNTGAGSNYANTQTSSIDFGIGDNGFTSLLSIESNASQNGADLSHHEKSPSHVRVNPNSEASASFWVHRALSTKPAPIDTPAFHVYGSTGRMVGGNIEGSGRIGFGVQRGPEGPLPGDADLVTSNPHVNAPHIVIDTARVLDVGAVAVSASGHFKISASQAENDVTHVMMYDTASGLISYLTASNSIIGGGGSGEDDDWLIEDDWDGAGSNRVTSSRDVLIEGNLTVLGQTIESQTTIETVNLVVEDQFIHLGSGSAAAGSGKKNSTGISFETTTKGSGSVIFVTTEEPATAGSGYAGGGSWQSLAFFSGHGS